jgi:hypothetical protein
MMQSDYRMEPFDEPPPPMLAVLGKYICFFAFAVVIFFSIPSSFMAWQRMGRGAQDDDLPMIVVYLVGLNVGVLSAFLSGLLFIYRKPVFGTLLLMGALLIVVFHASRSGQVIDFLLQGRLHRATLSSI